MNQIPNHGVTDNIESWCQRVLDLLDLSFAELTLWNYVEHFLTLDTTFYCALPRLSLFLSTKGGNKWIIDETSGFYGIFQIFPEDLPKPRYLIDKESLNSSTQAKLSLRSRFSSKHS